MDDDIEFTCFALLEDGETKAIFPTLKETMDEITIRLKKDTKTQFGYERIDSGKEFLKRIRKFDGCEEAWYRHILAIAFIKTFELDG